MTEAGEAPHFPPLFHTNTLAHALQADAFSGADLRLAPDEAPISGFGISP